MSDQPSLEARLAKLESITEIRAVMADYSHCYDSGWEGAGRDPDRVANLFVEDGAYRNMVGREQIRSFCAIQGAAKLSLHLAANPKIEVDGDKATGAWAGLCPLVTPEGEAMWVGGRYECAFRREDGAWKLTEHRFLTAFQTPYDDGFGKIQIRIPDIYNVSG